jgi:hypothetical protein
LLVESNELRGVIISSRVKNVDWVFPRTMDLKLEPNSTGKLNHCASSDSCWLADSVAHRCNHQGLYLPSLFSFYLLLLYNVNIRDRHYHRGKYQAFKQLFKLVLLGPPLSSVEEAYQEFQLYSNSTSCSF